MLAYRSVTWAILIWATYSTSFTWIDSTILGVGFPYETASTLGCVRSAGSFGRYTLTRSLTLRRPPALFSLELDLHRCDWRAAVLLLLLGAGCACSAVPAGGLRALVDHVLWGTAWDTMPRTEIWESYPLDPNPMRSSWYWLDIPFACWVHPWQKKIHIVLCQFLFFVGIPISPPTHKNEKKIPAFSPHPICFAMRNSDPGWGGGLHSSCRFIFECVHVFQMCSKILPYPNNFQ